MTSLGKDVPHIPAQLVVDSVRDYAIFTLDATGTIRSWNSGARAIKGYDADEVIGRHFSIFYTEADRRRGYPQAELAAAAAIGRYEDEGWRVRKGGERFWADVVITALRDDAGTLIGFGKVTRDLTERRGVEVTRRREAERFRAVFHQAPTGLAVIDLDGRFLEVNRALCTLVGVPDKDLLGTRMRDLLDPDDAETVLGELRRLASGDAPTVAGEMRLRHADGHDVTVSVHVVPVRDEFGSIVSLVSHVRDLTEQRRSELRLAYLADHDELTGLLNRRRFAADVQAHVERCRRYGAEGAVLILDLDDFKTVNDTLGHPAGDMLIRSVADALRHTLRAGDTVARIGGDEFGVLLPRGDAETARAVGEKLCLTLRTATDLHPGTGSRPVTASIGVAAVTATTATADDLLMDADLGVFDAKESGRDGVATASGNGSNRPARTRMVWSSRIEAALAADTFVLHAQPILDLATGVVDRYELLIRMLGPGGEVVPPVAFIGVAERSGLIVDIDRWVVRRAVDLLADPRQGQEFRLNVNLSGVSITRPEVCDGIESTLLASEVDPRRLCFEVTETTAVQTLQAARDFANRLRALGCTIALDDFGAGFGSFFYLKHLPFDHVKIDGEFVAGCLRNRSDRLVVQALVGVARGLGKNTVAEFVEDEQTLTFLREEGVDFAQGFHIGRPAPLDTYLGALGSVRT